MTKKIRTKLISSTAALVLLTASMSGAAPLLTQTAFADGVRTVCPTVPTCSDTNVQDAVTNASDGDIIDIQSDQVITSPIAISKQLTIESTNGSVINTSGAHSIFTINSTGDGSTVSNLTFTKTDTTSQDPFISLSGADNITIAGNTFNGNWAPLNLAGGSNPKVTAIQANGSTDFDINNNTFSEVRNPAYFTGSSTGTVTDNHTDATRGWTVESEQEKSSDITFSGNTWGQNVVDIAFIRQAYASQTCNADSITDAGIVSISKANDNAVVENQCPGTATVMDPTLSYAYVDASDTTRADEPGGVLNPYSSISDAVSRVAAGGTIQAAAGTYAENVTINKDLTLKGASSDPAGTVIQPTSGNGITVAASGTDSANPLTIQNLRVTGASHGVYFNSTSSHVALSNVASVNNTTDGIEVSNNAVLNDLSLTNVTANGNPIGFRAATTGTVDGLTVTDSHFDNNSSEGWYINADSGSTNNQNGFTNINVSNTSFSNDILKGFYAEKLDNATFDNITVDNSGTSGGYSSGFNVNEKYGDYKNITVKNSSVTNSGLGDSSQGTGFDIEARDDGGYASKPATLDGVTLTKDTITGNQVGIRFGETGKNNAGPTNVTVSGSNLSGSVSSGINNQAQAQVDATGNWWGAASGPADNTGSDGSSPDKNTAGTGSAAIGAVKYGPWCTAADCSSDSSSIPGQPTGLRAKFQYDSTDIANGSYLSHTSKSGGNNLELLWNAPSGWVTGYHVLTTYPDNTQHTGYQGPNTNAWLTSNGFGQHGNGKYTFQVVAVNSNGSSTPSDTFTLYYDNTKPTVAFTSPTPAANSYENGDFTVGYTAHDNVALKSVNVGLFDTDSSHSNHWVATCYSSAAETGTDDAGTCTVHIPASVPDGTYYIQVGAQDQALNWSVNATRTIKIDRSAPAQPTSLHAKFQYDSSNAADGSYLSYTSKSGGNNLELLWDTPSDWVTGYHILTTYPDGTQHLGYQGPNTNAWLKPNGFGQHGNGKYTFQVVGVNPNGTSTPSDMFTLYYDNTKPTVAFTSPTPAAGSYVNNDFTVGYTASDNVALKSVNVSLFDTDAAHSNHWVATCYSSAAETGTSDNGTCTIHIPSSTPDGKYYIQVGDQDKALNWSINQTRTIYTDRTQPNSTNDLASAVNGTVTIHQLITDNMAPASGKLRIWELNSNGEPDNTKFYASAQMNVDSSNTVTYTLDTAANLFGDGQYIAKFTSWDKAGNASVQQTNFTVNNTLSTIVSGQGSNGSSNNPFTFFASLVQGGSGSGSNSGGTTTTTSTGGTGTGAGGGTGGTLGTNGQVLGASTNTPNISNNSSRPGNVKGLSTTNQNAKNSSEFLGLGWWWLPVLVIALLFIFGLRRATNGTDKPTA